MNRPLKFRIYSFLDKSFHYFTLEEGIPQGIAGGVSEPQQYIGLTDKNNNPIYEGDIVRFNPDNPGIATVEFKDYAWVLSESKKAFLPFCYLIKEEVEIIGNLFELPCSKPGAFDSNGECWTCDGWATDCPFINARELNPTK